jgi:DNA-binding transcriptional regulator YdaS (Cro superfamily)
MLKMWKKKRQFEAEQTNAIGGALSGDISQQELSQRGDGTDGPGEGLAA